MTAEPEARSPVLVLGLGNLLLQDDAVGLRLLAELQQEFLGDPRIEFVDGGTQGLALAGLLADRPAVLMLDAVGRGAAPGAVHRIDDAFVRPPGGSAGATGGAHQMNAGDLLLTVQLLGERPARACVVGIEPEIVRTGIGLSPAVLAAVPAARDVARDVLRSLLAGLPQA